MLGGDTGTDFGGKLNGAQRVYNLAEQPASIGDGMRNLRTSYSERVNFKERHELLNALAQKAE